MNDFLECIDNGHGGSNTGCEYQDLTEKEWNLLCGRELVDSMFGTGIAMCSTRYNDATMSQMDRGQRSIGADFVLSIHVNASRNPDTHGAECYVWPGSIPSKLVAKRILDAMPKELISGTSRIVEAVSTPSPDDDWLENPRSILKVHEAPCVLVEVGYASNEKDLAFLTGPWGISSVVCALRAGLIEAAQGITGLREQ